MESLPDWKRTRSIESYGGTGHARRFKLFSQNHSEVIDSEEWVSVSFTHSSLLSSSQECNMSVVSWTSSHRAKNEAWVQTPESSAEVLQIGQGIHTTQTLRSLLDTGGTATPLRVEVLWLLEMLCWQQLIVWGMQMGFQSIVLLRMWIALVWSRPRAMSTNVERLTFLFIKTTIQTLYKMTLDLSCWTYPSQQVFLWWISIEIRRSQWLVRHLWHLGLALSKEMETGKLKQNFSWKHRSILFRMRAVTQGTPMLSMIIPFVLVIWKEFAKVILVVLWLVLVHLPPMMFKWASLPLVLVKDAESRAGQTGLQEFRTMYLGLNQLCAPTARANLHGVRQRRRLPRSPPGSPPASLLGSPRGSLPGSPPGRLPRNLQRNPRRSQLDSRPRQTP